MDDWFANAQTAPERQLGLAKSYLSPELKDWFDLVKLEDGIGFCDWPALKDILLRRYRDKHVRRAAKKKIAILKYTGTVSDYNNKFNVEALKLKKAGTNTMRRLDTLLLMGRPLHRGGGRRLVSQAGGSEAMFLRGDKGVPSATLHRLVSECLHRPRGHNQRIGWDPDEWRE
uniref:Retrotransposon gag domain-containing protein n=1 Tax=Chromera velia CCMP2878 TaxID=1169474 RepID=A0A0G4G466_9ALVE|eukprot:Cvel_20201.t1-p1 / transcript=Cvel_20201.t1 / gene=Cvel_20201 / organism=Chromera_velia_CCMP2878 / gene_product=hypothetical protein / transcript_product=hypothetical protein / location=Cvel_scaffold1797:7262-8255(-) / protein_length=171 / sequence_SO=supercontig / SO=protein_coding / is_pseudo=false